MLKLKLVILVAMCGMLPAIATADSIDDWSRNYDRLVAVLQKTAKIGDCSIRLETDPNSPAGSFDVLFETPNGTGARFEINPPSITRGRSRVSVETSHRLRYASADFVGWINLVIQLDEAENFASGATMTKTLPSGEIYDQGLTCGSVP